MVSNTKASTAFLSSLLLLAGLLLRPRAHNLPPNSSSTLEPRQAMPGGRSLSMDLQFFERTT